MTTLPSRPPLRRPGLRLRRRPIPYWLAAALVALATAALVGHISAGALEARDRWGARRAVLTIVRDVGAGERLDGHNARVQMLPRALVPENALGALPARAVALVDLRAGETVLASRLAGRGRSMVAARLPRGTRGVAVPAGSGLPVSVGDRVDVLATFEGTTGDDGAPTFTVAQAALVVHVGHDAVTVAVPERAAARVAYALVAGAVTLVLTGTSSPPR